MHGIATPGTYSAWLLRRRSEQAFHASFSLVPQGIGNITTCSFRMDRASTEYLVIFFTDIVLFYVVPLLLSVVLYSLIARILLAKSKNKFPGGLTNGSAMSEAAIKSNQSRVQVGSLGRTMQS